MEIDPILTQLNHVTGKFSRIVQRPVCLPDVVFAFLNQGHIIVRTKLSECEIHLFPTARIAYVVNPLLAGWWFGTCFIFPYIGNVIIPIDER